MKSYFVCGICTLNSIFSNDREQINVEQNNPKLRLLALHISSHNSYLLFQVFVCLFLSFEITKICLNLNQMSN